MSRIIEDDAKRSQKIEDILKRIKARDTGSIEAKEEPAFISTGNLGLIFKKKNSEQITGESRAFLVEQESASKDEAIEENLTPKEGTKDLHIKGARSGKSLDRIVKNIQHRLNSIVEKKLGKSLRSQKVDSPLPLDNVNDGANIVP